MERARIQYFIQAGEEEKYIARQRDTFSAAVNSQLQDVVVVVVESIVSDDGPETDASSLEESAACSTSRRWTGSPLQSRFARYP